MFVLVKTVVISTVIGLGANDTDSKVFNDLVECVQVKHNIEAVEYEIDIAGQVTHKNTSAYCLFVPDKK